MRFVNVQKYAAACALAVAVFAAPVASGVAGEIMRVAQATPEVEQDAAPSEARDTDDDRPTKYSGVWWTIQEWLARANRTYQGVVVKGLSAPAPTELATPKDDGDLIAEKIREVESAAAPPKPADAEQSKQVKAEQQARARAAEQAKERAEREQAAKRQAEERQAQEQAKAEQAAAEAARRAEAEQRAEQQRAAAQREREKRQAEQQAAEAQRRQQREAREAAERDAQRQAEARALAARNAAENEDRQANDDTVTDEGSPKVNKRTFDLVAVPIQERSLRRTRRRDDRLVVHRPSPVARPSPVLRVEPISHARGARPRYHRAERRRLRKRRGGRSGSYRAGRKRYRGACRGAGRRIRPPGRYVVRPGDNLWRISRRHYRKGRYYRTIYRANRRKIRDPDLIYPCQKLRLPRLRR